ncbi:gem-associated protein 6 [Festucalex cinctus]
MLFREVSKSAGKIVAVETGSGSGRSAARSQAPQLVVVFRLCGFLLAWGHLRDMQCDWPRLGPLQWATYVNKELRVTAGEEATELAGWLLTVDPVSASLVLVSFAADGDGGSAQVVMGEAVRRVQVLQDAADADVARRLRSLFPPPPQVAPGGADARQRDGVRRWLEKNGVPVEERGERLMVAGALALAPPYGPDDCSGANAVVLERVRKILEGRRAPDRADSCPPSNPKSDSDHIFGETVCWD